MSKLNLLHSLRFDKGGLTSFVFFIETLPLKCISNQFVTVYAINLDRFQRYLNSSMFSGLLPLGGLSGIPSPPHPFVLLLVMFSWDVVKFFWKCLPFAFIVEQA